LGAAQGALNALKFPDIGVDNPSLAAIQGLRADSRDPGKRAGSGRQQGNAKNARARSFRADRFRFS
jgi:hypothetical protein